MDSVKENACLPNRLTTFWKWASGLSVVGVSLTHIGASVDMVSSRHICTKSIAVWPEHLSASWQDRWAYRGFCNDFFSAGTYPAIVCGGSPLPLDGTKNRKSQDIPLVRKDDE
jgi:hypothetical protein